MSIIRRKVAANRRVNAVGDPKWSAMYGAGSSVTSGWNPTKVANNFTVELWAQPTATCTLITEGTTGAYTTGWRCIIGAAHESADRGAGMNIGTNGFQFIMHGTSVAVALASYATTISAWTHLTMRASAKQGSLLLNGALVRTGYTCPTTNLWSPKTHILSGDYGTYAGNADEIRIWNYVRTEAETVRDMYRRVEVGEPGLIQLIRWSNQDNCLVELVERPILGGVLTNKPVIFCPPPFIMEY